MTQTRKLIVKHIRPPIPIRRFDWEATREGWDLSEPIGYGPTKQEAIDDLLEQEVEQL